MSEMIVVSTEELGFSLALLGYDEISAGLLKVQLGELSEEAWELIFQTVSHGLLAKGLLLKLDENNKEECLLQEYGALIHALGSTQRMIRCVLDRAGNEHVLMIHSTKHGLLYQVVINHVLHMLRFVPINEVHKGIDEFFNPTFAEEAAASSTSISEEDFQSLADAFNRQASFESIMELAQTWDVHQECMQAFVIDSLKNQASFSNISYIVGSSEVESVVKQADLIMFSDDQTWLVHNQNTDMAEAPNLAISSIREQEWNQLLRTYIEVI